MTPRTLENIEIGSPCTVPWDSMQGTSRVRFCGSCRKNVYNLSEMTRAEAETLLAGGSNLCVRLYKRADGSVTTQDCQPATLSRSWARVGTRLAAALGLALVPASAMAKLPTKAPKQEKKDKKKPAETKPLPTPPNEQWIMGDVSTPPPPTRPEGGK